MTAVPVILMPAVAYDRPDFDGMKPLPAGYDTARLTIVRADQVREGDLVVGSVDQPVSRARHLRWATYLAAAFVAQPGPECRDCKHCRVWMSDYDGPTVTLYPHCPERADALISIIPAPEPVGPAERPCVHTCDCKDGRVPIKTRWVPWPVCWRCHGQACASCRAGASCAA